MEPKSKTNFLEYYNQLKEERYESKGNYDNWDAAQKHLEKYCSSTLRCNEIDENFIKGFKKYLDTKAKIKSGTEKKGKNTILQDRSFSVL
ncbi:phage integrase SAM-like domain-containing protein [Galbibacter sp. EGI 63066]|uniref:phage integrase SAM-like domain-containing protein n=1 Tax=Galbibacter sp. EGI 63066 TaxID=2993559 RepID=UPI0022490D2B|nr:phage integrase SAM-like domain-containing protein [Galbibacter sp. EGI 63066]MCX2679337.1 phage integrase SAM-like domain-containing protein [Galbibacter sp. EGI 63066]